MHIFGSKTVIKVILSSSRLYLLIPHLKFNPIMLSTIPSDLDYLYT